MPTFTNAREYKRAKLAANFYQFHFPPIKLSRFLVFPPKKRQKIIQQIRSKALVKILCYVFMPNHFHFLVQQTADGGISKFMSNFQNSYTRYFNVRNERIGPLFLGQFKAVRIETEQQLLHISRYIHLNPYSSYVVKSIKKLEKYPWSSLPKYLDAKKDGICDESVILSNFSNTDQYKSFVFNHADYQRSLEEIKHLAQENI